MQAGEAEAVDARDEVPEGATVKLQQPLGAGRQVKRLAVLGWFAHWAVRLTPCSLVGFGDAVVSFNRALLEAFEGDDVCLVRAELAVLVAEALRGNAQVQAWSGSMDLGALERNVVRSAWEEALGEAGEKMCVFQVPNGSDESAMAGTPLQFGATAIGSTSGMGPKQPMPEPRPINIEVQLRDTDPDRIAQVFAADMERMVRERQQPVPVPERGLIYLPREEPPRVLREPQPLGEWLRELGRDFMTEARIGLAMLVVIALLAFLLGRLFGFVR